MKDINIDEAFFRLILQMNRVKLDRLAPQLKTHELGVFYIIDINTKEKGGAYVSEIAELLNIPLSGVSRILRRMEDELGFIVRTPDPKDRRNTIVSFTDKGRENYENEKKLAMGIASRIFNHLTHEEQLKYIELTKKLHKATKIEFSKLSNNDE